MNIDKKNSEGYIDMTSYEALTNITCNKAADKKAAYLPLVYICSPYAGDVETNVKNAKRYSRFAVDENAIPVTPLIRQTVSATAVTACIPIRIL